MKKVLFILIMTSALNTAAQLKMQTIKTVSAGPVGCKHGRSVDMAKSDTTDYISLSFQNSEYTHIIDSKSVFFLTSETEKIGKLVNDLKAAKSELGSKSSMEWKTKDYNLRVFDFTSKVIYFYVDNGNIKITPKDADKIIAFLEEIIN
jgi:hypothetical protein